jgi:hypothetical protein
MELVTASDRLTDHRRLIELLFAVGVHVGSVPCPTARAFDSCLSCSTLALRQMPALVEIADHHGR